MSFLFAAAWCGHTDDSRLDAADLHATIAERGWKKELVAQRMGLTLPQLSRQLAGQEPLNHWRLSYMPADFQLAYLRRRAARFGASIVTADERSFILACAQLGKKRMAKYLPEFFKREQAS